jgi:hypothetical protein
MQGKPHIGGCVLKGGLLFGGLMFVFLMAVEIAFPVLGKCLSAPAIGLADVWHGVGLPPRGEAAVMLPFLSLVVQCFLMGALIGLWRYRRLKQKFASLSADKAGSGVPPAS